MIIRSHGVSKRILDLIEAQGLTIVDATCPFVKKIHHVVMEAAGKGQQVVIIGSAKHPEVEGIRGFCTSDNPAVVIENVEAAEAFENPENRDICIVSQTTFNQKNFKNWLLFSKKKDIMLLL